MVLGFAGIRLFDWGNLFWGEGMKVLIVVTKLYPLGGVVKYHYIFEN